MVTEARSTGHRHGLTFVHQMGNPFKHFLQGDTPWAYFIISQDDGHFQDDTSWQGPLTSWPARMMGPKFGAQLWGPIWAPIFGPKFAWLPCVHKAGLPCVHKAGMPCVHKASTLCARKAHRPRFGHQIGDPILGPKLVPRGLKASDHPGQPG